MKTLDWSSGARSVEGMPGDGRFTFRVPAGVGAVSVGLVAADFTTAPEEHLHAFYFEGGRYYIAEGGVIVDPGGGAYTTDTTFAFIRLGEVLYYCVSGSPGGASLSDTVKISKCEIPGKVYLDASLAVPGDEVLDAAIDAVINARALVVCGAMQAAAAEVEAAQTSVSFAPLQITGISRESTAAVAFGAPLVKSDAGESRAHIKLGYMAAGGSAEGSTAAHVEFGPMGIRAGIPRVMLNGAIIQMMPRVISSTSHDGARVSQTIAVMASQETYAGAHVSFGEMYTISFGRVTNLTPTMWVDFPSFTAPYTERPVPTFEDATDVAVASEIVWPASYTVVDEVAVASEGAIFGVVSVEDVEDAARGAHQIKLGTSLSLWSSAAVSECVFLSGYTLLTTTARASDVGEPYSVGAALVTDGARAAETMLPAVSVDLTSTTLASDHMALGGSMLVTSVAAAGEGLVADSLVADTLLTDGAFASEATFLQVSARGLLEDVAIADDELFARNAQAVAWVMNTSTGAVSWYDNWPFTSMVEVGGKVFAAGPEGLHVLGGDKDGADLINASVQYGFNEFGGYDRGGSPRENPQRKRVQALWFGYHADGVLSATVETYGQGYGPFTYEMPPREAHQPRNNRIIPGRGLNSRYWRLDIANTNGCAFEVHSVAADVAESTRRI